MGDQFPQQSLFKEFTLRFNGDLLLLAMPIILWIKELRRMTVMLTSQSASHFLPFLLLEATLLPSAVTMMILLRLTCASKPNSAFETAKIDPILTVVNFLYFDLFSIIMDSKT